MAGWEDELAVLLRELRVTQDESAELEELEAHQRPTQAHEASLSQERFPSPRGDEVKRKVQSTDALFWGHTDSKGSMSDKGDTDDGVTGASEAAWMSELHMMRREVNTIVSQVVHLMQHGDLDSAFKEDVLVVLRALRRRASVTQQAAASEIAYLEFAAAMLHFCRLVLRLSEVSPDDF